MIPMRSTPAASGDVHGLDDLAVGDLARGACTKIVLSERAWKMSLQPLTRAPPCRHRALVHGDEARRPRCRARPGWSCSAAAAAPGGRRLGQGDVEPLLGERRHDHEDDEQHQHHVDEGRDVDVRLRLDVRRAGWRRASGRSTGGGVPLAGGLGVGHDFLSSLATLRLGDEGDLFARPPRGTKSMTFMTSE